MCLHWARCMYACVDAMHVCVACGAWDDMHVCAYYCMHVMFANVGVRMHVFAGMQCMRVCLHGCVSRVYVRVQGVDAYVCAYM